MSFVGQAVLGVRKRAQFALFRIRRRRQLRELLRSAPQSTAVCPVCGSSDTVVFKFTLPNETVHKSFCRRCEHLFTESMQTDIGHVRVAFEIEHENEGAPTQLALLRELAVKSGVTRGRFLDFGVGGNISAFQKAAVEMPRHSFMGCDVYPATVPGYFNIFETINPGTFDGISSYAVVEHLTDTRAAWERFNRMLKPVQDGGGIMIHSFPSQWNLPFDDWAIEIQQHTCLFSRKSLRMICAATGFEITGADPPRFVGPHYHAVMEFRKVRDI